MEFNFNVNNYFKNEITTVGSRLIPDGFIGDRREVQECISRVSYVLNVLGENSAKAQGLQRVITSGEKLRNTDHVVYILVDSQGGSRGNGSVLGMLKMGMKHLYVFDMMGNNHEVTARCVLDFYVHESKQRMGLGKKLFQFMLKEENVEPRHLAIDKPSPKFLSFLRKHYGLDTIIPQMNNFVVFDGFFTNRQTELIVDNKKNFAAGVSSKTNNFSSGRISGFSTPVLSPQAQQQSSPAINVNQTANFGRPAPHRPISTVGLILQHKTSTNPQQPFKPDSTNDDGKVDDNSNKVVEEEAIPEVVEEEKVEVPTAADAEVEAEAAEEVTQSDEAEVKSPAEPIQSEPVKMESNGNNVPPLRCNAQASKPQHLDLKFYHSSLW